MTNANGAARPTATTETDFGVTDRTTQIQIAKTTFRLSDLQATGLCDYIGFTATRVAEVVANKVPGLQLRRMSRRDYGRVGGATCDLGHQLRYLWTIQCGAEDAATAEERHFGTTCAAHAMGLTQAEITLVKSLDRWTIDLAKREMLRTLGQAVAQGRDGGKMWELYTASPVYQKLTTALSLIKGKEEQAVTSLPPAVISSKQDKRRLQALGRICTAVETAEYLIAHHLPVPVRFRYWIERAANRVARSSRRHSGVVQPGIAAAPPVAAYVPSVAAPPLIGQGTLPLDGALGVDQPVGGGDASSVGSVTVC
ncbi:MAG TPA: hypothetical protein VJZ91_06200 [Blastocatellia bacterium]|nr:hypothetical protein [Blastocatellia bacterium]